MYLLRNRMNTAKFFTLLKSRPSLPTTLTSNKKFHLSSCRPDSDDKNKEKDARKAKLKKLNSFMFVQVNKPTERPAPEPTKKTEIKAEKSDENPEIKRNTKEVAKYKEPDNLIKNRIKSIKQDINPKVVNRLARLIDPVNTEKTAEILTKPIDKVQQKNSKDFFDLRSILDDIKQEKLKRPNTISFKTLMKSEASDYTLIKPTPVIQQQSSTATAPNKNQQFTENRRVSMQSSWINNVPEYTGQAGDIFQWRHRLTGGQGLKMFSHKTEVGEAKTEVTQESPIWEMFYEEQLSDAELIPPINGFEEMITLTKQGKLWNFPIDNEQGVNESEARVSFAEHVFLDTYLEEFPAIEPVQEFMALALNGLSKNSFLSVEEKRAVVDWYKGYFKEKNELIVEALETERLENEYRENLEMEKERQNKNM